jgi:bifunctional DNA-binding transcriptional regulator/antitoxin component of YhaV-PrlF toxin-antitoxin module
MTTDAAHESTLSEGAQAAVPAKLRRALGMEPGDTLRWRLDGDELRVKVVKRASRGFAGFDGYDARLRTDAVTDHDAP